MAGGRVDLLRVTRSRPVAPAVVRRAQVRAAFDDLAGNLDVGGRRVVAALLASAARILRNAASLRRVGFVPGRVPVGGPFPDVADHVVEAVAVRRERRDRRGAFEAVLVMVLARKFALPGVGHVLAAGRELVAPGVVGAVEPAARREFPFGFGRQLLAGPARVSERVGERHVHDRMIVEALEVALGSVRMAPIGALGERPPLAEVAQIDRVLRRREHQRARVDHVRQDAGIVLRVGRNLRDRDVTRRVDEFLELPVRHRMAIDPEAVDRDAMNRRFLRIVLVRAHAERAAGNEQHVLGRRAVECFDRKSAHCRFVKNRLHQVHR